MWPATGFAARKSASTVYLMNGSEGEKAGLLARLGPHTTGRSCLYLEYLDKVDLDVLRDLIRISYRAVADS